MQLVARFIPAADEVYRLQTGDDAECVLFQKIAEQGHYAGRTQPSSSRQGTYATTADGTLLASWNNNNPRRVAEKLREALEAWDRLKAEGLSTSDETRLDASTLARADRFYPEGGLVLKVNTRDLPRETPQEGRWADSWNQDFAWFTAEEARRFLPDDPEPGKSHEVPRELVERLVRFHLLDNVRGQTSPFPSRAIEEARITSEVTEVDGDRVTLRLEGRTKAQQGDELPGRGGREGRRRGSERRGLATELLGFAEFDLKDGRFVAFEAVAVGERWGGTRFNVRNDDPGPAPFGIVLSLAGEARSDRIAPEHFPGYGWR